MGQLDVHVFDSIDLASHKDSLLSLFAPCKIHIVYGDKLFIWIFNRIQSIKFEMPQMTLRAC